MCRAWTQVRLLLLAAGIGSSSVDQVQGMTMVTKRERPEAPAVPGPAPRSPEPVPLGLDGAAEKGYSSFLASLPGENAVRGGRRVLSGQAGENLLPAQAAQKVPNVFSILEDMQGSVEKFCRWIQLDPYVFFVKTVHSRQGKGQCFLKPGAARYKDEKNAAEWVQICRKEFGSRKLIFQRPAAFFQGHVEVRGRDEGAMKEMKGTNEKRHMPGLVYTGNAQRTNSNRTRGTNAQSSGGPLLRLLLEFKTRCPANVAILFGKHDYAELSVGSQLLQKVHSMVQLQEEQTSMGPSSSSAALHGIWGRYGGTEMGLGARLAAAVHVILSSGRRPTSSAPPRPQSQSRELELTERCHELADTLARGSKAWKKTIAGDPVKELEVQAKVREAFCPEAERPERSGASALRRATRLDDLTYLVKSFVLDDDDETIGLEAAAAANKTSRGSVLYSGWVYAAWSYYEQVQCSVAADGAGAGASAASRTMDDMERSVGARLFGSLCENEGANAACDIDAVRERSKLSGRIYARLFRDVGQGSGAPGASDERQNDTSGTMGSYRGQLCELFQKGQHVFYHSGTRTLIFHAKPFVETEIASASKASTLVRIAKTVLGQVPVTPALVSSSSTEQGKGDTRNAMRALRSRQITDEEELKRWRHNPGVDGTFKNLAKEYVIAVNGFAARALRKELGSVQQELLDTEQTAQTEAAKPGVVSKSEAEGASGSAGGAAGASPSIISLEHVLFDSDSASWPWVPAVATSAAAIPIDGHPQFLAPTSRSTEVEQKLVLPEAARAVLRETDRLIYAHNYELQDSPSFTGVIGAVPAYRIATTENMGTEDEVLCAAGAQANGDDAHAQNYHHARTTTSASSTDPPVLVVQSAVAVAQTAGTEDSPAANVCAIWVDRDPFDPSAQGELRVHGLATLREVGPRREGTGTAAQTSDSSFEFAYAVAATGGGDSCLRLASDLEFYVYDEMQKKRHAFLVGGDKVSVLSMEKNLALLPKGPVHEHRSSLGAEGDVGGAKPSKMLWTSVAKTGAVLGEVAVHLSDLTEFAAEEEELGAGASVAGIDLDAEGGRTSTAVQTEDVLESENAQVKKKPMKTSRGTTSKPKEGRAEEQVDGEGADDADEDGDGAVARPRPAHEKNVGPRPPPGFPWWTRGPAPPFAAPALSYYPAYPYYGPPPRRGRRLVPLQPPRYRFAGPHDAAPFPALTRGPHYNFPIHPFPPLPRPRIPWHRGAHQRPPAPPGPPRLPPGFQGRFPPPQRGRPEYRGPPPPIFGSPKPIGPSNKPPPPAKEMPTGFAGEARGGPVLGPGAGPRPPPSGPPADAVPPSSSSRGGEISPSQPPAQSQPAGATAGPQQEPGAPLPAAANLPSEGLV